MKTKLTVTILLTMALASANAQEVETQGITQGKTPTGQPKFPLEEYTELPQLKAPIVEEWKGVKKPMASWGDIDFRYEKHAVPMNSVTSTVKVKGWKGEHVSMQAVVWTPTELESLTYQLTRADSVH